MPASLTFPLAILGFALLAGCAPLAIQGKCPLWLKLVTAVVIAVHVFFVWAFRYEWSFAQATRNGYFGFALFHTALGLIVTSPFLPPKLARMFLLLAFLAVCLGANGAVYRYDVVAAYRIPVHAITLLGAVFVIVQARRAWSHRATG